jgi:hypothetical protein
LKNANETQLQAVFSGTNCNASAFGLLAGGINIFVNDPLSGTMNTAEATVFRRPTVYPGPVLGISQEKGVDADHHAFTLDSNTPCAGGGFRFRAIGTEQEMISVRDSNNAAIFDVAHGGNRDGIGYAFFNFANFVWIANQPKYGYITLNGVDPIFASYGTTIDPGQPTTPGVLPAASNMPAACGSSFPCAEQNIWANGLSFPNLRNGTYRSWANLYIVGNGSLGGLIINAQKLAVESIPDFVPAGPVSGTTDPGLKLLRSHYLQRDGSGVAIGKAPSNVGPGSGGDMGGAIIPTLIGVTTNKETQLIQSGNDSNLGPVIRP